MTGVGLAMVIGAIGYGIYDLILVAFYGRSSTISQFLITTCFKAPFICVAFGFLAGHLFAYMWPMEMPIADYTAWRHTVWVDAACAVGVYEGCRQIITAIADRGMRAFIKRIEQQNNWEKHKD